MYRTPPLITLGLLLVASMVAGCDRTTPGAALLSGSSASTIARADGADGGDGAAGAKGATVISNTTTGVDRLPKRWPDDVLLPNGARVAGMAEVTVNGTSRMAITGTTPLSPNALREHFESTLDEWDPSPDPWADGRTAAWTRGDERIRVRVDQDARGRSTFEATVDA